MKKKKRNNKMESGQKIEGIISISSKGTGYVAIEGEEKSPQDPEIDFRHLNTALHGDLVEILLHPFRPRVGARPAYAKRVEQYLYQVPVERGV